jgi:hypothetical protein
MLVQESNHIHIYEGNPLRICRNKSSEIYLELFVEIKFSYLNLYFLFIVEQND